MEYSSQNNINDVNIANNIITSKLYTLCIKRTLLLKKTFKVQANWNWVFNNL